MIPKVLSIAGSDPSGGAGIQADLKTFSALGVYGMAALTSLTAQNTKGVRAVQSLPPEFVRAQIEAVFDDVAVHAVKIGMIASAEVADVLADVLEHYKPKNIVLDPVMVATSGDKLISDAAIEIIRKRLVPLADLVTPNRHEAEILGDLTNAKAVLFKGGHDMGAESIDVLKTRDGVFEFTAPRILTANTHGTGCTLSSAIAAFLAKGLSMQEACGAAKEYLTGALKAADALGVGHGHGPVHHFWNVWKSE
jgi:hydroxymethylpyrimidine/phosphomethylpyrimidine kinase